ncbi:hypothetical protein [Achromobacter ruhlandii]|uniref:hypothetical protein n=1 Tax=Achromobacter ruhlandii TaxID=72557 RepID=UPI001EEED576|nr:hypothetical protein [Achromobacter ruhlandii]
MLSALRVLTTKAPQVADTARRVVTNHTQKQVALPFVRQYTMSMRHQPSTITTQIRHYSSSSTPPDDTGGGSGIQRTRGHSTAGTQGHPSPATPSSQGPGLLSIAVDALVNAVSALFGQTGTASPPLPTVAPERAKEVYAYLGDHSFKRPSAQPFQGDAQAAVRFHQQRASETATSLGVPKSVADQMPPEADLAMWMYQQAQTDGGSVDDNHVPPPFNGRDFNQALRGDAPLRTGESRPPRDTHDARDISREKLIAGLELRVLTPPPHAVGRAQGVCPHPGHQRPQRRVAQALERGRSGHRCRRHLGHHQAGRRVPRHVPGLRRQCLRRPAWPGRQ